VIFVLAPLRMVWSLHFETSLVVVLSKHHQHRHHHRNHRNYHHHHYHHYHHHHHHHHLQPRRAGSGEGMSREEYIAVTAKDIYTKIPLASMDVGSYDLLQTRAKLLLRNGMYKCIYLVHI
jgi:hypothetical protein